MVGFGIGLMVAVVYWAIIYWSDLYGYSLRLSPFWLMWFPNILILSIGASVALGRMRR
jgi:lipopolysaccharide export LptBFGC system permease protein LptF